LSFEDKPEFSASDLAYLFTIFRLSATAAAPEHKRKKLEGSGAEIKGVVTSAKFPPIAVNDRLAPQSPTPGVIPGHPPIEVAHPGGSGFPAVSKAMVSRLISKIPPGEIHGPSMHPERYMSVTPPRNFTVQLPNTFVKHFTSVVLPNIPAVSISRVLKPAEDVLS